MQSETTLRTAIADLRSIASVKALAEICGRDSGIFNTLIALGSDTDRHTAVYATWTATHAADMHPFVLKNLNLTALFGALDNTAFSGVRRNLIRILQTAEFTVETAYTAADFALRYLNNPKEDIAVRAFSVTVLQNCSKTIPEILPEVLFLLEKELPYAGAAIAARAKRFLKSAAITSVR